MGMLVLILVGSCLYFAATNLTQRAAHSLAVKAWSEKLGYKERGGIY